MKTITTFALFFTGLFTAHAGWYQCYNYTGTVGKSPVTLSIQITHDYFGAAEKKNLNINGIYQYTKYHTPIRLEGVLDPATKQLTLYELHQNSRTATFTLPFTDTTTTGVWTPESGKSVPVQLTFQSKLTDTALTDRCDSVEILQATTTPDFYFVGVYAKAAGAQNAVMTALKVCLKKDGALVQHIDFSKETIATGNLMTLIYDNVTSDSPSTVKVSNQYGRVGGQWSLHWNAKKNCFVKASQPELQ
jgi:hypothetical protein